MRSAGFLGLQEDRAHLTQQVPHSTLGWHGKTNGIHMWLGEHLEGLSDNVQELFWVPKDLQ